MYKSSLLCRLAICRRVALFMFLWVVLLLGAYEIRNAAQQSDGGDVGLKRLAVYGFVMRANR